jgi:hypothetical protein
MFRLVARLLGEFLREAAVLVAVFGPLEMIVQEKRLTVGIVVGILTMVIALFSFGVLLEVSSRWKD